MKKILIGFCFSAFLALFAGCAIDHSLSFNDDQDIQSVMGESVAHFSVNFNVESLSKFANHGRYFHFLCG
jgi:hypothetical protein